jgi:cysteine synthase A
MVRYNNILEAIGNTPIIKLNKIPRVAGVSAEIYVKLESRNPGGCIKERIGLSMIEAAEKAGILKKDSIIVEPTSGNTGIGLAMVCAVKGYKLILTMPETMSIERRKLLKAYGAELILTPPGMPAAIKKAEELAAQDKHVYIPQQFKNLANPEAHRKTTGPEIWKDMDGKVDVFVSAVGTGGTLTGTGEFLRSKNAKLYIIAVEPDLSPVLSGGKPGAHAIQGIGAGFVPDILNTKLYNEIITVSKEESFSTTRDLAKTEGILVGISSGAALAAAIKYAKRTMKKENIVVILPDTGERYLSTELWDI